MVLSCLLSALSLLLSAAPASAQDLDTYALTSGVFDANGTPQIASPRPGLPDSWYLGAGFTWANAPVLAGDVPVVDHQIATRLAGGYTLSERVRLEASLPLYPSVMVTGEGGFALGDASASAMIGLGPTTKTVQLGVMPFVGVPTGSSDAFVTAGGLSVGGLLAGAVDAGAVTMVADVGVSVRPAEDLSALADAAGVSAPSATVGTRAPWGVGASARLNDVLRAGVEVDGWIDLAEGFGSTGALLENPAEAHVFGGVQVGGLSVNLGAGRGLVAAPGVPAWRAVAGVGWRAAGEARIRDADGDGFGLTDDACPELAEDMDGFEDFDGCPDLDNDQDGLSDAVDECPLEAGAVSAAGCPDTDGDGVSDNLDRCPEEAADTRDGCAGVNIVGDRLMLQDEVSFVGQNTPAQTSLALLDEVAALLVSHPGLTLVEIGVHTASASKPADNQALSQARAAAVRSHLVAAGVAAARLYTVGYGDAQPSNERPGDRVDFVVLDGATIDVEDR